MSSTGNRSNPNETRVAGHQGNSPVHGSAGSKPDIGKQGGASHQESRDHNKHNTPGQSGHKPQHHHPEQEKH
jgi:hypothetical protein